MAKSLEKLAQDTLPDLLDSSKPSWMRAIKLKTYVCTATVDTQPLHRVLALAWAALQAVSQAVTALCLPSMFSGPGCSPMTCSQNAFLCRVLYVLELPVPSVPQVQVGQIHPPCLAPCTCSRLGFCLVVRQGQAGQLQPPRLVLMSSTSIFGPYSCTQPLSPTRIFGPAFSCTRFTWGRPLVQIQAGQAPPSSVQCDHLEGHGPHGGRGGAAGSRRGLAERAGG